MFQVECALKKQEDLVVLDSLISKHKPDGITIVDKDKSLDTLQFAAAIRKKHRILPITMHYAVSNHYSRDINIAGQNLVDFIIEMLDLEIYEILLISGGKPQFNNTVTLLNYLADQFESNSILEGNKKRLAVHVAFNPHLSDNAAEINRLKEKFSHDFVKGVYFQVGDNLGNLENGINYMREHHPNIHLFGCLFIPNQKFLNAFKFRPWYGVNLSSDYLNNLAFALKRTSDIYDLYKKYDVVPLLEFLPFSELTTNEAIEFFDKLRYDVLV